MYDELLFKQPDSSYLGDCPICCLPMPLDKFGIHFCCSQKICIGCVLTNQIREKKEVKEHRCPFCRQIVPETDEAYDKLIIKRAKLNDPIALHELGNENYRRGNYERAFHYYSKAIALGDVLSIYKLSIMYCEGEGVEKDSAKERALLEKTAIAGHPDARYNLGCIEEEFGRLDKAVKHWIIAANLGHEKSTKALKDCYKHGHVSKDDFAAALRANQAAVDERKSPQREAAKAFCGSLF